MVYSKAMRIMHWLMAVLILGMILSGFLMVDLAPGEQKWQVYGLHKSFGVTLLGLIVLRILIRLKSTVPPLPQTIKPVERKAAHGAQFLLYVLMVAVPVSGFVMSDAGGHAISLFGLPLPDLLATDKALGGFAHEIHEIFPYLMLAIILAHAGGALKHQFFDRKENRVLKRMWKG